jgi:predicted helicase
MLNATGREGGQRRMQITTTQKRAIDHYYQELAAYHEKKVTHETAVRSAFQNLLATFAQSSNWVLIPEQTLANGKRPDGTLRDSFNLPRGYWEAKDTKDDLSTEIRKKITAGYPISNTIFEDTRRAILYQNSRPILEVDLTQPKDLTHVLDEFFHYAAPDIATFERAVEDFKESIPDLAQGLLKRIKEEHARNKSFVSTFAAFLELSRSSLDPNMSSDTVDEMLVQHLLTERLFRTIFQNQDFTRRNVIAAEIEKVIQTLTSRAFNRSEFEKSTDRFYLTIENAARNLDDWSEKQHFLNTVYERFFQGFSVKQADTHGIVYTPQEIVNFMCNSVEEVLKREFDTSIAEPGVQILDPCTGTGSFIVNLVRNHIPRSQLKYKYEHDLFCNEIMLLPYYIASLNIEHEYYDKMGEYLPFEGICFADTLALAEGAQLSMFVEENTERVQHEKDAQIMVVIGNPPYNVGQKSENDNNKNRKYLVVDSRIRETYVRDSKATLHTKTYDAYVKFFRWAIDRLQGRDGIVCFISNNSFVSDTTFDGMRKHLEQDFTQIYHIDLGGDIRSDRGGNVFGITVGVGITILVRRRNNLAKILEAKIYYYRVANSHSHSVKLAHISEKNSLTNIVWQSLDPDRRYNWFTEGIQSDFADFLPMGTKEAKAAHAAIIGALFKTYALGVSTNRDTVVYNFDRQKLTEQIGQCIEDYNAEVSRWSRAERPSDVDNFVRYEKVKWSEHLKNALKREKYGSLNTTNIRIALYRPFSQKWLYYDSLLNDRPSFFEMVFPNSKTEAENSVIVVSDHGHRENFSVLATKTIPDLHLLASKDGFQCFPYYTYANDGSNRRENITDWALAQFQAKYGPEGTKRDIFHYVYAMLHHLQYRERYAENLKRDLPHIPLLYSTEAFQACTRIGKQLMELHLHYEKAKEYPLQWVENQDTSFSWRVEKIRLTPDRSALVVNQSLTLSDIPPECFTYRLGNRSALEWVIDQYQVSEEKRSGIVSDPNNPDDEEYIVHLVGKVITVSMETVKLVNELAQAVTQEDWMSQTPVQTR